MNAKIDVLDVAFAFAVIGAASIAWQAGLLVGAAWLVVIALIAERRAS